ncbi:MULTISPECIES: hypothetical protein [unclassified Bradyrhizobium]|uniref:hypothetical protein n=1 Tax=unclassified Bradyrhizobium TaxID=2631580 RepID=UPI001FF7D713|nr:MULTISPECIES: hypothetical protein [unclassified Bradyrhizobium]
MSDEERAQLKSLTMRRKTARALALRARIVLTCAEGGQNKDTSLFAALDIASGRVIGKCYGRHRAAEFRKFLDRGSRAA